MGTVALSKRELKAAKTREKLIDAAVELYGSRSIDAVSLREIGVAAGQKNPNVLQYHFQDKEGLLQAIVDKHALAVAELREAYIQRARNGDWSDGEAAARCLVMPIIDYVESTPDGIHFVRVVSQIAAIYQNGADANSETSIQFPRNKPLVDIFEKALQQLSQRESQRRIYLVVTNTFHSIADIYSAGAHQPTASPVASKGPMVEQLVLLLHSFFSAQSLTPGYGGAGRN